MRNLVVVFFLFFSLSLMAQVTPKADGSVPSASTPFGVNVSAGQKIYNQATHQLFICNIPTVASATLTSAAINFRDLGDYYSLENVPVISGGVYPPSGIPQTDGSSWLSSLKFVTVTSTSNTVIPSAGSVKSKIDSLAGATISKSLILNYAGVGWDSTQMIPTGFNMLPLGYATYNYTIDSVIAIPIGAACSATFTLYYGSNLNSGFSTIGTVTISTVAGVTRVYSFTHSAITTGTSIGGKCTSITTACSKVLILIYGHLT